MNPLRGLLMAVASCVAFYIGWTRHGERAWMAFGLGLLAMGLAVWHWRRSS